jgi:hypothetical protein
MSSLILFEGKQVETSLYFHARSYGKWLEQKFLAEVVGYWIYPFRILYWIAQLILIGAIILAFSPAGREKSVFWRLGASAQRVLPIIQLNKEFNDFFDDPDRTKVTSWQMALFCILGVLGWILGLILVGLVNGAVPKLQG